MGPQIVSMCIGLWLMAAPAVLGYGRPLATSDHIAGPLIATFACIAIWECTRSLRWVNLALGAWVVLAPWALSGPPWGLLNGVVSGTATAFLASRGGEIRHRFGGGWEVLWPRASAPRKP